MKYIRELPSADEIKNQFSITNKQRMMREKRIQEKDGLLRRQSRLGTQFLHRSVRETAARRCRCQKSQRDKQADIPYQTPQTAAPARGAYAYLKIWPHLAPLW